MDTPIILPCYSPVHVLCSPTLGCVGGYGTRGTLRKLTGGDVLRWVHGDGGPLRYAIVGGTGMIGTQLASRLRARGDDVWILTRGEPGEWTLQWDSRGIHGVDRLEALDAVFNLTGAPIADRPWTRARRELLRKSRVQASETIIGALARLQHPPKVYVGAGGLGIFGDCGDEEIDDDAPPGEGFLAELSLEWERAHLRATDAFGARTVVLRKSIVLGHTGGVFQMMRLPFQYGIGGWLGHGRQYTAWISLRDAVSAYVFAADTETMSGAYNATVPDPVRNKEWCKALGRALSRPVLTHAPRWALRGALGELADDLFLASVRAVPRKLEEHGFAFEDTDAEQTFRRLIEASKTS